MFLLIDNYDSFTYNIVHYLSEIGIEVMVVRNDKITLSEIKKLGPKAIFISPGPSSPDQSGICLELIEECKNIKTPIFGVCLGHQAIAQVFGAKIILAAEPMHGKVSQIFHKQESIFQALPSPFKATRYHSLIIDRVTLSDEFKILAETEDNLIMAIEHRSLPMVGVQFHPESIATEYGLDLFRNFIMKYVLV